MAIVLQAGFRNSGMVISNKKRYTVAVRNTQKLELPISKINKSPLGTYYYKPIINNEYEKEIIKIINKKFKINLNFINKLFNKLN